MNRHEPEMLTKGILSNAPGSLSDFEALSNTERDAVVDDLLASPEGRRWLRAYPDLSPDLAARLLDFEDDLRSQRQDRSLGNVVAIAPHEALDQHFAAIASGAGAPALWERLAAEPGELVDAALRIIASGDPAAIENTVTHLLLDPVDPYRLGRKRRTTIAAGALDALDDEPRGIAAEYLATAAPQILVQRLDALAHDCSARVRGYAWLAGYRVDRDAAAGRATAMLGDETLPPEVRKSALNAAGEALPTDAVADLLTYFVVHPSAELAIEAASLLFRHHRHPQIALAAAESPHPEVREIAAKLLDPYRGSPAAGGSRPGDTLRTDPLIEMLRRLEEGERE